MKFHPILVDDSLQELTKLGTDDFPISVNLLCVQDEGCYRVQHWHEEIQILLMIQGNAVFETPSGRYDLKEGTGLFINSGILHRVFESDSVNSMYICVNFKPSFIDNQENSLIYRDYVRSVIENAELQSFALYSEPWHKEILETVREMNESYNCQEYGYEVSMRLQIYKIWRLILAHYQKQIEKTAVVALSDRQRIHSLKQFIHLKYMHHITLKDIAYAGHVSQSECCRIFRRTEQMSPIQYLRKYRISQSTKYLDCTGLSIADISYQVGFESTSYFISCFRREMLCTPGEYRNRHRHESPH